MIKQNYLIGGDENGKRLLGLAFHLILTLGTMHKQGKYQIQFIKKPAFYMNVLRL